MSPAERAELDRPTRCPYCGSPVSLTDSARVYQGRDYGKIYLCDRWPTCDAYVGTHSGTDQAKGRLANAELRRWKIRAHGTFDALWKDGGMKRKDAYALMGEVMSIPREECHIGWFTIEQCQQLILKLEGMR